MGVLFQVVCAGIICNLCMGMGFMFGWPSSTIKLFESTNTTLDRPMTKTEVSLFGSLSSIGALVSVPLVGFGLDRIGRKYCAILTSVILVIAWTLIAAFNKVEVILAAMFLSGISCSVFLIVPVYVGEICQESIRGALCAGAAILYGFGLLLSYLLGGCVSYKAMIYICLTESAVGTALVSFLKESPMLLMKKGLIEEAAKSLAFYRRVKVDSKVVVEEMSILRRAFNPDLQDTDKMSAEEEKLQPDNKQFQKPSLWQFVRKSRSTQRATLVTITLATAAIFQGLIVVQVFAEPLFSEAVPNVSTTVCCVLLALVTVLAGLAAAYLTDIAGRRPLMIYSSVACGVCCVALGTQLHISWAPHWMTAVFIYMFSTAYTFGAGTVPFVLLAEVFLPEVKSFMSMLVFEWAWLCNFVILFIFNPLVEAMGLGPVFYIFAVCCFLTSVFAYTYLPETKGLTVDAIQLTFLGKASARDVVHKNEIVLTNV